MGCHFLVRCPKCAPVSSKSSNLIKDSVWIDVYNSSFLISSNQKPQIYHKSKLVVGVENMPYKNILEPLLGNTLLNLGGTVSTRATQDKREIFKLNNGTKVAPIICYESVYGEYVTQYVRNGAQFLAIITNDGWWSESQGYKQHLSYAKIRSIETRRSIARSANTGSSAIINKKGEIIKKADGNEARYYLVPDTILSVKDGQKISAGDVLARLPKKRLKQKILQEDCLEWLNYLKLDDLKIAL